MLIFLMDNPSYLAYMPSILGTVGDAGKETLTVMGK